MKRIFVIGFDLGIVDLALNGICGFIDAPPAWRSDYEHRLLVGPKRGTTNIGGGAQSGGLLVFVRGGSDLGGASLWPEVRTLPVDDTKWRARSDFRWSIYLVGRPDGKGETEGVFTLNSWGAARRGISVLPKDLLVYQQQQRRHIHLYLSVCYMYMYMINI